MATYEINKTFTLAERAKASLDGRRMMEIIDVLNVEAEDFFNDVPFQSANLGLLHKIRRITSKPSGQWRTFNQGVKRENVTTQVVYEPVGLVESRNEIDEDEIDTVENGREERANQDKAFITGMGKTIVQAFIYGARSDGPERIDGLYPRLTNLNNKNVISAGATGSNLTSMLLVEWSVTGGAFGIYPPTWIKNASFGISVRPKGKEKVFDANGDPFYAYVTQFKAWLGLGLRNELKIARLCNVNPALGGDGGWDENKLIQLLNRCKFNRYRTRIYCNTDIATQIEIRAKDKSNVKWSTEEIFGKEIRTFSGVPIRPLDVEIMPNNESVLS